MSNIRREDFSFRLKDRTLAHYEQATSLFRAFLHEKYNNYTLHKHRFGF